MNDKVLHRYLYGKITEKEQQDILDWLDSDPEKHTAYLNWIRYIEMAVQVHGDPALLSKGKFRRLVSFVMAVAASIGLLFGVWHLSNRYAYREMATRPIILETPAGQRISMRLPDGTSVQLNAGTKLEYPQVFAKGNRRVKLSGEAMFEVSHDARRPFIVETFASEIEVLGTKFNVLSDAERIRFRTTLIEGSVKVTGMTDLSEVLVMQPHDVVELVGKRLTKRHTENFDNLCWTEGIIYIESMPFDELMRRIETAYNVRIDIERETLPKIGIRSGKIRISDGVDYALQILQQVSDFQYERDDAGHRIVIR